jgi:hypothetical protein
VAPPESTQADADAQRLVETISSATTASVYASVPSTSTLAAFLAVI